MFPLGPSSRGTMPLAMGSPMVAKTIGIVRVSRWTATVAAVELVRMMSGRPWVHAWACPAPQSRPSPVLSAPLHPNATPGNQAEVLRARFDRIFKRGGTGYVMLDRLLRRLFRNKDGLLRVLDRPEIPLNTNASEN